ncbi:hypothetical protein STAS_34034 [Striga asiatica]|uniref:Uncharacterized protein n=1 Tax=Striga asiatica TaxID=4170 RepID=A0A5A7RGQ2_STRAF|nr:hypothetical protein STAS_34034 [Striga asiatica]
MMNIPSRFGRAAAAYNSFFGQPDTVNLSALGLGHLAQLGLGFRRTHKCLFVVGLGAPSPVGLRLSKDSQWASTHFPQFLSPDLWLFYAAKASTAVCANPNAKRAVAGVTMTMSSSTSMHPVADMWSRCFEFTIARPTEGYAALLAMFPRIFVGRPDELRQVVKTMCAAIKKSMKTAGIVVPPWRRLAYVQSKWFGPHERTTEGSNTGGDSSPDFFARHANMGHCSIAGMTWQRL